MSTFAQMQSKIADDLNRTDLTTQIQREINRAIRKYAKEPFWFSSKELNFLAVADQYQYGVNDDLPSDIRCLSYVRIDQSSPTVFGDTGAADAYVISPGTITSYTNDESFTFQAGAANTGTSTLNIDAVGTKNITTPIGNNIVSGDILAKQIVTVVYNSTSDAFEMREVTGSYYELTEVGIDRIIKQNVNDNPGLPLNYAWFRQKLYLYPIPDRTYIVTLYYDQYYADLSADGDTNNFTTNPEAEQLIEQEAEYQIYSSVLLDQEMAAKARANRNECLQVMREVSQPFLGVGGDIRATYF